MLRAKFALSGFSMTYDYQGTVSVNSFVDGCRELRKRDARSLFSCEDLGSILEAVAELLTASANLLTAADFTSLCESSLCELSKLVEESFKYAAPLLS